MPSEIQLLKKVLFVMLLCSTGFYSCSTNKENEEIRKAIRHELDLHPKSSLADIYKNFFQDAFGPGHMIPDSAQAMNYLLRELDIAGDYDGVDFQPLGYKNRYYRVNLSLVRDSILSTDLLFNAFVKSANTASPPPMDEWIRTWNHILGIIEEMDLEIPDFEEDKKMLDIQLQNGDPVVHHSEVFKKEYSPHYRIVSKEMYRQIKYSIKNN